MVLAIEPMVNAGGPEVRMGETAGRSTRRTTRWPPTSSSRSPSPPDGPRVLTPWHSSRLRPAYVRTLANIPSRLVHVRWLADGFVCLRSRLLGPLGLLQSDTTASQRRGNEGPSVRKADVREVQGDPPRRRRARDLLEPPPQAEAGLIYGADRRGQHPPQQAGRDRPHLRLRHRPLDGQQDPRGDRGRPDTHDQGPDRGRDRQAARGGRVPRGRGRPAPGALPERQAPAGDRLLPRPAPPARPARAGSAHQDQRPRPQGPAPDERRRQAKAPAPK